MVYGENQDIEILRIHNDGSKVGALYTEQVSDRYIHLKQGFFKVTQSFVICLVLHVPLR